MDSFLEFLHKLFKKKTNLFLLSNHMQFESQHNCVYMISFVIGLVLLLFLLDNDDT